MYLSRNEISWHFLYILINICMYNDFYVYALYYPSGGDPFYIGKGRKARIDVSARYSVRPKDKNNFKRDILREIYSSGKTPIKRKLLENVDESVALDYEKELISFYGRLCDNSGILANIATNSALGNTGWVPTQETRNIWSKQRSGATQTEDHIDARVEKNTGKKRSNRQRYNCLLPKIEKEKEKYKTILDLFNRGYFIEKIYSITNIDRHTISKIIKNSALYTAAINNMEFSEDFYKNNLKWSCQKISHIIKDKQFYIDALYYIDLEIHINKIVNELRSNHTRIRFIIKNKDDIREIIRTYE